MLIRMVRVPSLTNIPRFGNRDFPPVRFTLRVAYFPTICGCVKNRTRHLNFDNVELYRSANFCQSPKVFDSLESLWSNQ